MATDDIQDHRLQNLEIRVSKHGEVLDELSSNVAVLTESVNTTNVLLREALTAIKRAIMAISTVVVGVFGAGQVI